MTMMMIIIYYDVIMLMNTITVFFNSDYHDCS